MRIAGEGEQSALAFYMRDVGNEPLLAGRSHEAELAQKIELGRAAWQLAVSEERSLTVEEELDFLAGLEARTTFLNGNLRLVIHASKGYWIQNPESRKLDIFQAGNEGMEHALEKFDWTLGFKFSTYATPWIHQAVQKHIRREGYTIHLPDNVHDRFSQLKTYERICKNDDEILATSGWSAERLQEVRRFRVINDMASMDFDNSTEGDEGLTLYDMVEDPTSEIRDEPIDHAAVLNRALEIARTFLDEDDYETYVAMLEAAAGIRKGSASDDSGMNPLQLAVLKHRTATAIKHPATGIMADQLDGVGWQLEAQCLGVPLDIFFPRRGESTNFAKRFCGACAVKDQCLDYALINKVKYGVWGGESERSRRKMRKELYADSSDKDS